MKLFNKFKNKHLRIHMPKWIINFANSKFIRTISKPFHKFNQWILRITAPIQLHFSMNSNNIRDKFILGVVDVVVALVACFSISGIYHHGIKAQIRVKNAEKEKVIDAIDENPDLLARMPKAAKKYDFVHEFAQMDEDQKKKNQILPSIVIAQAALESNWGKSQLYTRGNNPFGIKGEYHGQGIDFYTNEYSNGKTTNQKAEFKKYPNLEAAVEDHNKLLLHKYFKGVNDSTSYIDVAKSLQSNHYATDPKYAQKIEQYIKQNNLDRFD